MLCFRASSPAKESSLNPDIVKNLDAEGDSFAQEPMTVQQAFAEMIGKEELTLPRYQVCMWRMHRSRNFSAEHASVVCSVIPTSND